MTHDLKIYPEYFEEVIKGNKTFECRFNDRNFQVGDTVILNEWDNGYSGREAKVIITYILDDKFTGISKGYVVFSLKLADSEEGDKNGNRI